MSDKNQELQFMSDDYLNYVSKISVDDSKKDQLLTMDMNIQNLIKINKQIREKIDIENDYNGYLQARIDKVDNLNKSMQELEKKFEVIKQKNVNLEQDYKKSYSKNNIETLLNSLKFFTNKTKISDSMIKPILVKALTWSNYELILYSFIPVLVFSLTSVIGSNSSGRFIIECFSLLLWLYFIAISISKHMNIFGTWNNYLFIDKFTGYSFQLILMMQYCLGFSVLEKSKFFRTFPLLITDLVAIVFMPRPNNGQHGRPSRPVCGSEPADLSDLAGRPKRPSRPT
ncbi:hypothetical protein BpHYR1_030194 [Brachionus plicatilis]|uniref:Uncharacterized protein n=1 Tax=Brachionus plicatilis TaxID=10195 RepID=A0A3M7RMR0_BRAPC|nr:hypothetical protein BpHYR1_030194 [Brachionus plicatilis]